MGCRSIATLDHHRIFCYHNSMTLRHLWLALLAASLLPSCAYMQTHKNVRAMGRSYQGYKLTHPQHIYRSGDTWYVAATPATYRLSHDIVHDNVFRKTNEPVMELQSEVPTTLAYHAISADTAAILLREDGYAETSTIAREITTHPSPWLDSLPGASAHAVKAHLKGDASTAITYSPQPAEVPFAYRVLGGIDFVLVDIPGTVIYNVAVPFIAPFVFFHEFLNEE